MSDYKEDLLAKVIVDHGEHCPTPVWRKKRFEYAPWICACGKAWRYRLHAEATGLLAWYWERFIPGDFR